MKKAFIIFSALALAATGLTSCEDWLEMPPYNETNTEKIFSSEETAEMYVEGCYRGMISKEMYYQLGSGDSVIHASEDGVGGSKNALSNFFYDSKSPYTLTTSYKESYRIIEATNIGIDRLSKMPESDKRNALLAECYCIRAFMYYNLIRIYGDMPAVWQPMESMDPEAEETFYPHRASRDEIYDHIIADMQGSIDYLPTKADGAYGGSVQRLTRDGAYACLWFPTLWQQRAGCGPTAAAIDALRQVRARAGIGDMSIPTDMEGFTEALAQERKWEFAGELWLRTDLIRMGQLTKQVLATQTSMRQLSAQEGIYSNTPTYRLYKLTEDPQKWADNTVLAIDHIDITDPAEVAVVSVAPSMPKQDATESNASYKVRVEAAMAAYQAVLKPIVEAHGYAWDDREKWYACNMFEGMVSDFNNNCRKAVGFTTNKVHVGVNISESPTGKKFNKDKYPVWIHTDDNSDGIYYGFKENCCELLPLADKSAGHPRVDNPNLSQHPGYLQ